MSQISMIVNDPLWYLEYMLYRLPALLIALSMHEWAHAYAAYHCGDPTAKMMGRLTLNPMKHLDPTGTFMMVLFGFGWAKPVPVNPRNFKHFRRDDIVVSLAGITMNLLLFLIFMVLCVVINNLLWKPAYLAYFTLPEMLSFQDGYILNILSNGAEGLSEALLRPNLVPVLRLCGQIAYINLLLAVFNILPIPPLDGFHVFNDIILKGRIYVNQRTSQIMMGVILLLSFSGLLGRYMSAAIGLIQGGVLRLFELVA